MNDKLLSKHEETLDAIKRLCRVIIHDINNPLSAVSGYLQLIELRLNRLKSGDMSVVDSLIDFHHKTQAGLERVVGMVNRLDQFSKVRPSPPSPMDLKAMWARLVSMRSTDEQARIRLHCDELPPFRSLVQVVEQVALELLDNALWATREGGSVDLRVQAGDAGSVVLEITDEGPGIPPEMMDKFALPCYWTREKQGFPKQGLILGLGLPIVYQLVQYLEGDVEIQSQPGQGTTVRVVLPGHPE